MSYSTVMSVEKFVKLRHNEPLNLQKNVMEGWEDQLVADLGYGAERYVHAGGPAHFHFRLLDGFRICGYRQFPYYCAVFEWAKSENGS